MGSMVRVWPQCWHVVGGPRDNIWDDFVGLVWPIRSRVITTSSALVRCWNFLGGPSVGFTRYRSLPRIDTSHLVWTSCRSLLVVSNLQWTVVKGPQVGQGPPLLAGPLFHYPQSHNGLAPSRSGHMCLCCSEPRKLSWYDKWDGFPYLRPQLPASKTLSQSRIQHRALHNVPIIVQCQGNGCSLSSKDGAVIRESFGQLAAGHLTILSPSVIQSTHWQVIFCSENLKKIFKIRGRIFASGTCLSLFWHEIPIGDQALKCDLRDFVC